MLAIKNIVLAATAFFVAVSAVPTSGGEGKGSAPGVPDITLEQAASHCGSGNTVSCCNSKSTSSGLLSGLNVLGGQGCSPLDVNVLAVKVPISSYCDTTVACCSSGPQNGLVNIGCLPIQVPL